MSAMFAPRRVGAVLLTAALLVGLTSCRDSANFVMADGTYVLLAQPGDEGDEAQVQGTVTVIGSCLGIDDAIAIWPAETTIVDTDPFTIQVPDVGEVSVGDQVDGAGGGATMDDLPDGVVVPDDCDATSVVTFRAG
ncbi:MULTISPECIES: hypothetical protein [unclassified Nocardioides]|uniref:hypothetical protein n=1 Tax=unclassified Nocardioides TaxID=2615069 RepID=UPI001054DEAB|nr:MULTISPECIES: hypothetical protein [unclassified Nocardioides]